jgi:hypothetical protein
MDRPQQIVLLKESILKEIMLVRTQFQNLILLFVSLILLQFNYSLLTGIFT